MAHRLLRTVGTQDAEWGAQVLGAGEEVCLPKVLTSGAGEADLEELRDMQACPKEPRLGQGTFCDSGDSERSRGMEGNPTVPFTSLSSACQGARKAVCKVPASRMIGVTKHPHPVA